MAGRYGFDQFGGFLCISSLILIVIGAWVSPVLYWLGLAAIVYSYFRILSRNTRKRYSENLKYLSYQNRVTTWFGKQQVRFKQRKDYHYYRCPQCGQQLRVPAGAARSASPARSAAISSSKRVDARCSDMLRFTVRVWQTPRWTATRLTTAGCAERWAAATDAPDS